MLLDCIVLANVVDDLLVLELENGIDVECFCVELVSTDNFLTEVGDIGLSYILVAF